MPYPSLEIVDIQLADSPTLNTLIPCATNCTCLLPGSIRYLLAVNVMTASVLRRLVEMALTELQAFFELYSDAAASDRQKGGVKVIPPSDDDDISTSSTRSESRSGGDNGGNGNSSSSEGDDRESAKSSPASFCPPAFKVRWNLIPVQRLLLPQPLAQSQGAVMVRTSILVS